MPQIHTHSRNSLFLAELILALCFLSLVCAGCIRFYAAAWLDRTEARRLSHIRENTVVCGELLEGWDGTPEKLPGLFPDAAAEGESLVIRYDRSWEISGEEDTDCILSILPRAGDGIKGALLSYTSPDGAEYYSCDIRYPLITAQGKGAASDEG